MKPLFTESEYQIAKSEELLSCLCYNCNKPFKILKKKVTRELNHDMNLNKFCSKKCRGIFNRNLSSIKTKSKTCNNEISVRLTVQKKSKTGNNFCSQSCAATYNNTHKTTGNRRSKLEKYIETELIKLYPDLEIRFNCKDTINSELDIYIPSFKLAFELNGIFHYEPIYGQDKLNQIQNNDNRKFQACLEQGIELCLIDVSNQKYFKEQSSEKYLIIIKSIINQKIEA